MITGTVVIQGVGDGSDPSTNTILDGQNYGSGPIDRSADGLPILDNLDG